jgi:hypothetical protein
MHSDEMHYPEVNTTTKYNQISEDEEAKPGKAEVIVGPTQYLKVKKWRINRVFYFLISISVICLTTTALVPDPAVQATALAIWAGSAGLARYLLADAYRKPG